MSGGGGGPAPRISVTLTSIGLPPRPATSRSKVTKPAFSNRIRYVPAGSPSKAIRPPSVLDVRTAAPVTLTLTSGTGAPDGSVTEMAKVTGPLAAPAPLR